MNEIKIDEHLTNPIEIDTDTEEVVEKIFVARPIIMMWMKFRKHKLAVVSLFVLILIYTVGGFCEFVAPQHPWKINDQMIHMPPQRIRFVSEDGFSFRPFVYGYDTGFDPQTLSRRYTVNTEVEYPIKLFARGVPYKLWGLFDSDIHLIGVEEGYMFLLGTDRMGRDLFSRVIYGTRISTSIGLFGVMISFVIGTIMGGISGYFGGFIDLIIQRIIEFITSIPTYPLWMALSAALPLHWPQLWVYMGIVVILSLVGWAGLARIVRAKFISLREEDFVRAAKVSGAGNIRIVVKHMVPSFMSYLIASMTISIPGMILGETALSFIGLGLREPVVSWGVMLMDAQNLNSIVSYPWLLLPTVAIMVTVLCFNFLGDGLRDAADPYGHE